MSATHDPLDGSWLTDGLAQELVAELDDAGERQAAGRALEALAEALGEDADPPLEDPGLPAGYGLLDVLGRGASGVVYRAEQSGLGREVAVKVLVPGGSSRDTERLLGEARRLASLRHPAVVGIHEVGRARGGVFLALELYARSLHDALREGPLNPMRAARIVRQVAEGIAYTHAHGVVHLDLKPGNVLLDEHDQAAVADFGLAREVDGLSQTRSGAGLLGTPAFMAPEQAADRRREIGERTDVYGLGALLYACLAGRAPFEREGLADMLQAVRYDEPAPLEQGQPAAPRDLAAIAAKALAKEPDKRYPSASALAADLVRFEAGEPVEARLPGPWGRLGRQALRRRREIGVGLAGMGLAALSLLPREAASRTTGDAWLQAGFSLIDVGEPGAAEAFLASLPRWIELDARQERRAALIREQAAALTSEASSPEAGTGDEVEVPDHAAMLGLDGESWPWLVGFLGEERTRWSKLRGGSPLIAELTWKELLGELSERRAGAEASDQERILALADGLPHWGWEDGFAGWLPEPAPSDGAELLERLAAGQALGPPAASCEVGVQIWFFDQQGGSESSGTWTGRTTGAERLRFTGNGHMGLPVHRDHFGMDLLHAAPPYVPKSRPGDWRFELDGTLEETAAGAYWQIHDCELFLKTPGALGGWFVADATTGLLSGSSELVAMRVNPWGDTWTAIAMLVEVAEPGEPLSFQDGNSPSLEDWRARIGERLFAELQRVEERGSEAGRLSPAARAGLIDAAGSLAILGAGSYAGRLEEARDRVRALEEGPLGSLSEGFADGRTYTSGTAAGADLATWMTLGATLGGEPAGAVVDALPLPGSAFSGGGGRDLGWKKWITMAYLAGAVFCTAMWLLKPRASAIQLAYLANALLWSALCLDKTLLPALGSWPLDALGCLGLAWACWGLRPWARVWASVAAALLLAAMIQELAPVPDAWPRIPLALGMTGLLGLAHELDPRARSRAGWSIFGALFLVLYALQLWQPFDWERAGQRWFFLVYLAVSLTVVGRVYTAVLLRSREDGAGRASDPVPGGA